jgi:predicted hydrocarbon binding protein
MAKKKTVIRWQKKEPRTPHSFKSVSHGMRVGSGLSEVASWLDTSKPSEVLEDLRNFQEDWCAHIYVALATIRKDDRVVIISSCSECSHQHISSRVATSG